jgi:hypothetical protein
LIFLIVIAAPLVALLPADAVSTDAAALDAGGIVYVAPVANFSTARANGDASSGVVRKQVAVNKKKKKKKKVKKKKKKKKTNHARQTNVASGAEDDAAADLLTTSSTQVAAHISHNRC